MQSPTPSTNLPNMQPPGLFDIPLNDPLNGLVQNQLSSAFRSSSRLPYNDPDVINDSWEDTAVGYAQQKSWRVLATFSRQRLLLADKKDIDTLMKLWCYRLLSLININLCQLASAELDKLGDLFRAELQYEAFPELFPDRKGPIVPFTLQVIWARLPSYLGDNMTSIDRLYFLMSRCNQASLAEPDKKNIWIGRIKQLSILVVNYLIKLEDFAMATETLDCLIKEVGSDPSLQHIMFRIHIYCGNLPCARVAFQNLCKSLDKETMPAFEPVLKIDESLLHMAEGNWRLAQEVITQHLNNYPKDQLVAILSPSDHICRRLII
ncbi:Trafficking protein particle complex subunit 12 [Entomophthora muscae]|uniref:Trafficking protein particle complex subunit 12 n=1 Tax=Entomophthora muscae TaxID=34485 RepID=A0ACC2STX6_9FUNG|nr:Trafficking protein particle complex subunit 12 [Entomophthora muscae]